MTYPPTHISVSVNRKPNDVYAYASNPQNLKHWASGLSEAELHKEGDAWITDSPMGRIKIKFVPKNNLGVMDHDVTLPNGEINQNPFRVQPNGDGSEIVFTLYRLARMSDKDFFDDRNTIESDLKKLKSLLEN